MIASITNLLTCNVAVKKWRYIFISLILLLITTACSRLIPERDWPKTNFEKRTAELNEFILLGALPRDFIPSIDKPHFVSVAQASKWIEAKEPVIVYEYKGVARAYPLQIMIYHEIVNDKIADKPFVVTFCPLCNASIVYDRVVNGKLLEFGTTGTLRKSDLVMYDRQTESWWQQFTGEGIVGEYAGVELKQLDSSLVAFEEFKKEFKNGQVLSRDTGFDKPYGENPFRGYDNIDESPFLFFDPLNERLPPMERVLGVTYQGKNKIYPLSALKKTKILYDIIEDLPFVIFSHLEVRSPVDDEDFIFSQTVPAAKAFDRRINGKTLTFKLINNNIYSTEGTEWNIFGKAISGPLQGSKLTTVDGGVHFAFAWLAFNPNAIVYRGK